MARVMVFTPKIKIAIVCREDHADGSKHIHIFLEFVRKHDVRNPLHFDLFCPGNHCQITSVRNASSTLRYITKDGDYVLYGITQATLDIILSGTSYSLGEVAAAIMEHPCIMDIALKYPTHYIHYRNGIEGLCAMKLLKDVTEITPWSIDPLFVPPEEHVALHSWFMFNFTERTPKPLRSVQLWLHGPTQHGKSRFLEFLCDHWRGFLIPPKEHYYNGYSDSMFDFWFIDEFFGTKPLYFLNSLLGGHPMSIPTKHGQTVKRKCLPVVICSNLSPHEAYSRISISRPIVFEAFMSRLLVIDTFVTGEIHDYVDSLKAMSVPVPAIL